MLSLDLTFKKLKKRGEELCGDTVEIVRDAESTVIVLADGLGSGVKANILATLTAKIIATMIKNHLGIEEVVKTIIETLPVCRLRGIAYSTFTVVQINAGGEARIIEFDNPSAAVFRQKSPLPLQFKQKEVEGRKIRETSLELLPDDELFIFSDGVVHAGIGGTLKLGWQRDNIIADIERMTKAKDTSIYEKVGALISFCNIYYQEAPGDDSTIIGLKARRPSPGAVMIGPPLERERDREVVDLLMSENNVHKAVCGGTASKIVARETNRELAVHLDFPDPQVPPTGSIKGLGLVTEGALTIGKTLEILRTISGEETVSPDLTEKKDGASQLASFLLEKCTQVKFLIGRRENPAHQGHGFPPELSHKHREVQEIMAILNALGKKTEAVLF